MQTSIWLNIWKFVYRLLKFAMTWGSRGKDKLFCNIPVWIFPCILSSPALLSIGTHC